MKMNDELIHALAECIASSEYCMAETLKTENPKLMADCIQAGWDCSTICASTLHLLSRESKRSQMILRDCIDICKECEMICRKYDEAFAQSCADVCRNCYNICEDYIEVAQVA